MKKINTRSITFKLLCGGFLLTFIPLAVVGWISISRSTDAMLHLAHENIKDSAYEMSAMIETNLKQHVEAAGMFATNSHTIKVLSRVKKDGVESAADDIAELRDELKNAYNALGDHFLGIFVTDTTGLLLTGEKEGRKEYKGSNVSSRSYFQKAKKTGKPVVGPIVRSQSTGKLIYVACAPITSPDGEFLGIFGMSVKAHFLVELISAKHGETGYGWMVNEKGIIVAHPKDEHILKLDIKKLAGMESIIAQMMAGKTGVEDYVFKGVNKIAGFAPVPIHGWSVALTQDEAEFLAAPHAMRNALLITVAITMCIVFFLIAVMGKTITDPINSTVSGLRAIAEGEGDLTTRLTVKTRDEVGALSKQFNAFIGKLHEMITDINRGVDTLSSSSAQMSAISENLSDSSGHAAKKADTVAAAAEELTVNMNNVAAAMEDSTNNINTVASASEEMSLTINEIAKNAEQAKEITQNAVSRADASTRVMNELSGAADEIGIVVETITDISEQVNLLSLNATIEAARAGEAGKGFAVVANEIKELARQTSDASMDIKDKIARIQQSSTGSLSSIEEISAVIANVNDIVSTIATAVEEQSAATSEISQNISQASASIEEVNANVNQSSAVAGEISQDISGVNQTSTEVADQSSQVAEGAEALSRLAQQLGDMVGRFKV